MKNLELTYFSSINYFNFFNKYSENSNFKKIINSIMAPKGTFFNIISKFSAKLSLKFLKSYYSYDINRPSLILEGDL